MKVVKDSILIVTFSAIALLSSCNGNLFPDCDGDYSFSGDNLFSFQIQDKITGQNMLHARNMKYNYDTVTVYDEGFNVALAAPVELSGTLHLRFIDREKDKNVFDQIITKRFFMYFNYEDIDTVDIEFRMQKNGCEQQVMQYFKASYNGGVYVDEMVESVPGASFLK